VKVPAGFFVNQGDPRLVSSRRPVASSPFEHRSVPSVIIVSDGSSAMAVDAALRRLRKIAREDLERARRRRTFVSRPQRRKLKAARARRRAQNTE
jgi:ribosomal protein S21